MAAHPDLVTAAVDAWRVTADAVHDHTGAWCDRPQAVAIGLATLTAAVTHGCVLTVTAHRDAVEEAKG